MPPDHSEGLLGKSRGYSLDEIWLSRCTWRPESEGRAQKLYRLHDGASGSPFLPLRHGIGRLCSTPVSVKWEKSLSHPQEKKPVHCLRNWAKAPLGLKSEKVFIIQSCLTLCNPMDCSPPASSVHRILQARILKWVAVPSSSGSSRPRDQTWVPCIAGRLFTSWSHKGSPWGWLEAIEYITHFPTQSPSSLPLTLHSFCPQHHFVCLPEISLPSLMLQPSAPHSLSRSARTFPGL